MKQKDWPKDSHLVRQMVKPKRSGFVREKRTDWPMAMLMEKHLEI